ncbi:hypothetical protein GXB85_17425 [Cellulomonas sp. APG4]|uniref:CueP family metal-binding protein n=1 Tax=Cellulomonas sp. APG4 TaxID=1538656 RepID=UPI00137B2732|nr:CueP family metal-binding protein [Cellulomonas sp. APG4]NCT92717.1 hypothetical protein [Cellulomonas sp. APG4]
MRSRLRLAAAVVAATAVLGGCSGTSSDDDVLADLGLDGLTGQEIVTRLDASPESRPLDFTASVREDEVLVGDGTTEVAVPLDDGQFYVSISPYIETTHECYFHSLAGCQGELVDEPVEVMITDADGAVLVEENAMTYSNGFVGYWLPEDIEGTITVTQGDLSGSVPFSTTEGSPTCVTTLQLT